MNTLKFILLLFFSPSCILNLEAQNLPPGIDSIFIQIDPKLGKVVYHTPTLQQTPYGISRIYGVAPERVVELNSGVFSSMSDRGIVIIPLADEQIIYRLPLFASDSKYRPVYYRVKKDDNLFRISRLYFDLSIEWLIERNSLEGKAIQVGDALHIGWIQEDCSELQVFEGILLEDYGVDSELARLFDRQDVQMTETNEVAYWKKGANSKGYLVMHRHAPPHSIIEISNPLFGRKIYAKVIGNIPDNLYPNEIDMVISTEAARELKAIDHKFFVRSRYPTDTQSASR